MDLYAHSTSQGEETWQKLNEHLENVAALASLFAQSFGASEWADAAGLLHDRGKATAEYQQRLRGGGRVDHSTLGAQWAADEMGPAGKVIAACVAGHHGGLGDGKSSDGACLSGRLKKTVPKILENTGIRGPQSISLRFPFNPDKSRLAFQIVLFTRMLFSCLVDADFLDTERFLDLGKADWRRGFPELCELNERFQINLQAMLENAERTVVNTRRKQILSACLARAEDKPGIFSLTVPTGGGKTLSSLAFALRHALTHELQRIIYVIPFTSIIEQNAAIFRKFVGEDAVLEHHSAFDTKRYFDDGSEYEEWLRRFELASENWDAPLVVTTSVQFFESLFANRSSRCRKLHNICRSVIILDEVQMLPVPFLLPCLEAIKELASNYACTIILCTATQPALHRNEEFKQGLEHVREIMAEPKSLYKSFSRVKVEFIGSLANDQLAERLRENENVLCVVNTRREARELFELVSDLEGTCHLSALMCPEHRSTKLAEIKKRLARNQPCRLVSTRLIEAGVDMDFPVVFRALSGIDSIAQAAGRCNREGRLPHPGRVFVYIPEAGLPPGNFRPPAETAREIIRIHQDPLCLEAVSEYFRLLYWRAGKRLDAKGILQDVDEGLGDLFFPFKTIAEKFRLIRDWGQTVLVPWNQKAWHLLRSLNYAEFPGQLLRRLQRYTVQVPPQTLMNLENAGAIEWLQKMYPALTSEGYSRFYRDDVGLVSDDERDFTPESLVF